MIHAVLNTVDWSGRQPIALPLFWMHAPLAVTREEGCGQYKVTHIPTGWAITSCDTRAHAIRLARLLRQSFHWETVTRDWYDTVPHEDRHALGVAIMAAHYATSAAARERKQEGA
jgi:hypothetical protein